MQDNEQVFNVVFVLFDGVTQLDATGPAQFLAKLHMVSEHRRPIQSECGFSFLPEVDFASCPQADLLCVSGGFGVASAIYNQNLLGFIARQAEQAQYITSVCTGAFLLGAAGLLKGKKATTHWGYTHLLAELGAIYQPGRVVRDGNLITAGGVTSGIDFALAIMTEIAGEPIARASQLAMEYDPQPPYDGHPSQAPQQLTDGLRARFYDQANRKMAKAIADLG